MTLIQPEGERLSKRIMQLRACSRREAEQYIEAGFVRVDGVVVEEPQCRVSTQSVVVDAHASLLHRLSATLILHKPVGWTDGLDPLPVARAGAGAGAGAVAAPRQQHAAVRSRAPAAKAPARAAQAGPQNARRLLVPTQRSPHDPSGIRFLKAHLNDLSACVPLEYEASGLIAFTQDFRVQRKLQDDLAFMEHELIVEVRGEVTPDALIPLERAARDERLRLPDFKISVNSSNPERSRLRLAVKGAHLGLAAYLCGLVDLEVLALRRIRLGRITLGDLEEGAWCYLPEGARF